MSSAPVTVGEALDVAIECFRAADYQNARAVCDEILRVEPANADALHLHALAAANCDDIGQAIADLKQALLVRPNNFELLNNLGNFYKARGEFDLARKSYENALSVEPQCHPAMYNLANVMVALEETEAAERVYLSAIQLDPNFAEAYYNLGILQRDQQRTEEALESFKKCIARNTDHISAQIEIGNCLIALGRVDEAMNAYRVASIVDPTAVETFNNIAAIMIEKGRYAEAKAALLSALAADPKFSPARSNLGVVHYLLGEIQEAADAFSEVIADNPNSAPTYRNLARCLAETGAYDDAILTYRASLQYDPQAAETLADLAVAYAKAGYTKQALESFDQLKETAPTLAILGSVVAALPKVHQSLESVERVPMEFERALSGGAGTWRNIDEAMYAVSALQPDNLLYTESHNVSLLTRWGQLSADIAASKYPDLKLGARCQVSDVVKIAVVSQHHAVRPWRTIFGGLLANLNGERFSVNEYSTRGAPVEAICAQIIRDEVDVIVYPDLVDDPAAWQMASLRLAPVQCTTWLRGQSSGLPTIDYILSGELIEPAGAEMHYAEKLVRLKNAGTYIEPLTSVDTNRPSGTGVQFYCGQFVENYLPSQDDLFMSIAHAVPEARFVFAGSPVLGDVLKHRLHLSNVTVLTPEQAQSSRAVLNSHAFMDAVGCNDFFPVLNAVAHGLPIITLPGALSRTRRTAALLTQIDVTDGIALDRSHFVELAVRVAVDADWRTKYGARLRERVHWAYRDSEALTSFEQFLSVARS